MQINLIKETVSGAIGKIGEQIVDILYKKKNVNEFLISKKLNLTINQTRNLLYKLSDRGIVHFIRKKDNKKGGWYTYFWTLSIHRTIELMKEQIYAKIKKLEEDLQKRNNERFYYGKSTGIEYTEEEALELNFICPETGEVLQLKDNKDDITRLDIEISKLKILVEDVNKESEDLNKKRGKERERKLRVVAKKKEVERKKRDKQRKKDRKKEKKKNLKSKPIKKRTTRKNPSSKKKK